jgi:cytidine deaminase
MLNTQLFWESAMQNLRALSEADRELVRIAGQHAKERFEEGLTSIGGAVRAQDGKIYTGINLKYRVRNTSTCAEAMAIYAALNAGEQALDVVVGVKWSPKTDLFEIVNGCGWCRQLFCYNAPLKVIADNEGKAELWKAEDLLPLPFL